MALISDFTNTILHVLKSIAFAIKAHYPCFVQGIGRLQINREILRLKTDMKQIRGDRDRFVKSPFLFSLRLTIKRVIAAIGNYMKKKLLIGI